jgi:hypothetical protein
VRPRRYLRELNRKHGIKERVERALAVVKAFSIAGPSGIQLALDSHRDCPNGP